MIRRSAALAALVLASSALAQIQWPEACEEAVDWLLRDLPAESRANLAAYKKDELILLHHGFGTGIRNEFGLWGGNTSLIQSCSGNSDSQPDAVSTIIIERAWAKLQKQP
ncbi:MAG TPA: DUF6794 domain-containing protein [Afifellaceae bacterium]|nr:DUF6794 domain-containing protein [Afifellaceae bacterium]